MSGLDAATRELRGILSAEHTAPEWRWNARRRLTVASAALGAARPRASGAVIPTQPGGTERSLAWLEARLGGLAGEVLDALDAASITREVTSLLGDLELLRQRSR